MAVVLESNLVFTRGTPLTIFEASAPQLPGYFSGHMDLTQLLDANDEINVELQVKYSSGGTYRNAQKPTQPSKQADNIFEFTPVEHVYGYKLIGELLAASPSATATLEVLVLRSGAPI